MTTIMDLKYFVCVLILCGSETLVTSTTSTTTSTSSTTTSTSSTTTSPFSTTTSTSVGASNDTTMTSTTSIMTSEDPTNMTTPRMELYTGAVGAADDPGQNSTSALTNVTMSSTAMAESPVVITSSATTETSSSSSPSTTTSPTSATTMTTLPMTTTMPMPFNCTLPRYICLNNGTCQPSGVCDCGDSFTGQRCEFVRRCNATSCLNNGTCIFDNNYSFKCTCVTGDPNNNCALNTQNDCIRTMFLPRVLTCIDYIDGYELICRSGYSGDGCQNTATDDFCTRKGANHCSSIQYCLPLCNTAECNGTDACTFTIKPFDHSAFQNNSLCMRGFGDGIATTNCETEELLFDGFDGTRSLLGDCSPYFDTICTASFGDGTCNEYCNNQDCLWDGWDCANTSHPTTSQPLPVSGRLVVELKSVNAFRVKKVLGLLLRSKVQIKSMTIPVPHVFVEVSSTNFTTILAVGRFVAAAFAKLPYLLPVTDVFVCENGSYSDTYADKCNRTCNSNCVVVGGQDACDWTTGRCLHGCVQGQWGSSCNETCPSSCADTCDDQGRCPCMPGSYWSGEMSKCIPCSVNCKDVCNNLTASCTCKPTFYGMLCNMSCSENCSGSMCGASGECTQGCVKGQHGSHCRLTCPDKCQECSQDKGSCQGKCIAGYEGNDCQKSVMPPPVTNNTGVIIAVVLAILIVAIIIVTTYCCWKRRQSGDYVLEDEEMEGPVKRADTMEAQTALTLQPMTMTIASSTDMIDMDERPVTAGIYQGPSRQTVVATNNTDMLADFVPPPNELSVNGDVVSTGENESTQMISVTIDVGKTTEGDIGDGNEPVVSDVPDDVNKEDTNESLESDEDQDSEGSDDPDLGPSVPLSRTSAPLASEEDILLSKENLLAAGRQDEPLGGTYTDQQPNSGASSRKSSTSSKSSSKSSKSSNSKSSKSRKSSSGSRHSSKSGAESDKEDGDESKTEEPTTEM